MSLDPVFNKLRAEWQAEMAALRAEVEERLALIDLRQAQLHRRIRMLETHWVMTHQRPMDRAKLHGLNRSRWRTAKIPPRPKLMKIHGVGVDPPEGEAACRMI